MIFWKWKLKQPVHALKLDGKLNFKNLLNRQLLYVFVFKIGKQIYCISWTKLGLQISLHSFFKILRRTNEGHKLKSSWVSFFNFRRFWLNAVLSNKTLKTDVIDTIQLKHWCGQKMPILQWADSDPTLPFRGGWDLEFLKVKS